MELVIISLTAIALNILGAVTSKYIAIYMSNVVVLFGLLLLLIISFLLRILFWIYAGKRYQLSFLYPVLSINYIFSFLLGMLLFGEAYSTNKLVGGLIIVAGIIIISSSENKYEGVL